MDFEKFLTRKLQNRENYLLNLQRLYQSNATNIRSFGALPVLGAKDVCKKALVTDIKII